MKLSNQAMGAIMMALQKSLLEQTDIVPVLQAFEFVKSGNTKKWGTKAGELVVNNPPNFTVSNETGDHDNHTLSEEVNNTTGSD